MPFVSKAQIKKFYQLHKEGKIGQETIAGMSIGTKPNLPDHAKKATHSKRPARRNHSSPHGEAEGVQFPPRA